MKTCSFFSLQTRLPKSAQNCIPTYIRNVAQDTSVSYILCDNGTIFFFVVTDRKENAIMNN